MKLLKNDNKKITVIDLFSGVGGFSLGFLKASNVNSELIFDVRLLVDIDKEAAFTFKRNFPKIPFLVTDVKELTVKQIRLASGLTRPDLLIGGPPCQGFSQAGKRLLEDERNELVRDYFKLVVELKPSAVLMENVPNILTVNNGNYGDEIKEFLKKAGYETEIKVLSSNDYGVPQIRRRTFIFGLRKELGLQKPLFPPPKTENYVTVEDAIGDLPSLTSGTGLDPAFYPSYKRTVYQSDRKRSSSFIFNHIARNHSEIFLKKISIIPEGGGNRELDSTVQFSDNYFSQAYARLKRTDLAYTITTNFLNPGSGRFIHYRDLRSITAREAARLQSFDDDFIFYGTSSAVERHIGNAVPPLLSLAWAYQIAEIFKKDKLALPTVVRSRGKKVG